LASRAERAARARGDIRIGISGWRYAPWRGRFYPRGLAQKKELAYASRMLASIELNGSFYSLQRPASYQAWHDETPEGFVFAVKGSRYITDMLHLDDVRTALRTSWRRASWRWGRSWAPSCGNCRRTCVSTRSAWTVSCRCCRTTPRPRRRWRARTTRG